MRSGLQTALGVEEGDDPIQMALEDGTLEQLSAEDRTSLAMRRLRERYSVGDGWHLFEEVGSPGTVTRRVDAVALSHWRSRGFEIHGFEVKATRSDWLSELDDPAKSKWWMDRVDRWFLVAPTHVANEDEIPKSWGWIRLNNGGNLRRVVQAPELDGEPDRKLIGALAKQLDKAWKKRPEEQELEAARKEGYEKGYREGQRRERDRDINRVMKKRDEYKDILDEFGEVTGISLTGWLGQENLVKAAAAVKLVREMQEKESDALSEIVSTRERLARYVQELDEKIEETSGEVDWDSLEMIGKLPRDLAIAKEVLG